MIKFIEDKELCIKLKEKGFNEGCILVFRGMDIEPISQMDVDLNYRKNSELSDDTNYWLTCPTYCQVIDWFREKHKIFIQADPFNATFGGINLKKTYYDFTLFVPKEIKPKERIKHEFKTYYEALNKAIEEALKLI